MYKYLAVTVTFSALLETFRITTRVSPRENSVITALAPAELRTSIMATGVYPDFVGGVRVKEALLFAAMLAVALVSATPTSPVSLPFCHQI